MDANTVTGVCATAIASASFVVSVQQDRTGQDRTGQRRAGRGTTGHPADHLCRLGLGHATPRAGATPGGLRHRQGSGRTVTVTVL